MPLLQRRLKKAESTTASHQYSGDKNEVLEKSDALKKHNTLCNLNSPLHKIAVRMFHMLREFMIFCLVLMVYSALKNDSPKVSKPPAAYPFFPKDSVVKDFYKGQIVAAIEHARTSEFSFIMFYASWDADSQFARKEFLMAANYMKDVVFTAVNCWQPDSECRTQFSKVYRWPVIIAYPSFGNGVQYNGPLAASNLIAFLNNLLRPVKRIINETNLLFEEAFVVAEVNTLPNSMEYSVYYAVALKYLETDYAGRISFYVKSVSHSKNKISLYLWNQVRVLDIKPGEWNVNTILQWIIDNNESTLSWIAPSGSKSLLLSDHIQHGPSLILFTPKNPFYASDYYMMLQDVSQEYKNCDNWGLIFDMKTKRLSNALEYRALKQSCALESDPTRSKRNDSVTTKASFVNSSCSTVSNFSNNINLNCNIITQKGGLKNCSECRDGTVQLQKPLSQGRYVTSMWQSESDLKSMHNLRNQNIQEKCRMFKNAEKISNAVFVFEEFSVENEIDLKDFACSKNNESLTFIAIDSLMYSVFAEKLGIDLSLMKDMSAVVMLSEKMESHYVMKQSITSANLRQFIKSFMEGILPRSRKSAVTVKTDSPLYNFHKSRFVGAVVHVEELTSKNFLNTVLQPKKAVLVMYYSRQCFHCNGMSYIFLSVARKLSLIKNLQFARIDGDVNILSWEYTMEEFPTVLLFPMAQKQETRVFPSQVSFTVPNIIAFIIANVDSTLKLQIMYSVCLHTKLQRENMDCLATLRAETLSLIGKTLKQWRKADNRQRRRILHKLKQLKQLQLLFSHSPNDYYAALVYFKNLEENLSDDPTIPYRPREL